MDTHPLVSQDIKESFSPVLPVAESGCPVDALLSLITGPWTAYIVWILGQGDSLRFSELKHSVHGISARMLTDRLRRLEQAGLVHRKQYLTIPPQVNYQLTNRGRELGAALSPLEETARRWHEEDSPRRQSSAAIEGASPSSTGWLRI